MEVSKPVRSPFFNHRLLLRVEKAFKFTKQLCEVHLNMLEGKCMAGLKSESEASCEAHICKCEFVRPKCLEVYDWDGVADSL